MKAPHWLERRREYLAAKEQGRKDQPEQPAPKVISIAEGFMRRGVGVTVDQILDGVRCSNKFLAERLEPQSRGKKGALQGKLAERQPGAREDTGAPGPGGDAA
jgi:hypothetical protein